MLQQVFALERPKAFWLTNYLYYLVYPEVFLGILELSSSQKAFGNLTNKGLDYLAVNNSNDAKVGVSTKYNRTAAFPPKNQTISSVLLIVAFFP